MVRGLDIAKQTRASGGGRKMFLTSPYIEQAITLKPRSTPPAIDVGGFFFVQAGALTGGVGVVLQIPSQRLEIQNSLR